MTFLNKGHSLTFIFITILIDVIGLAIIIPVIPKLIEELTGGGISIASRYGGWLLFTYAIMQFIFSPVFGGLSDKYGRRPVLLLSLFGMAIDYVFMALAPTIFWLFIGRALAGIAGASFSTATAYIADISPIEKRAQNFGLIGVAFGLGFIIGPALGGFFAQFGSRVPFVVAAILAFLNLIYGYFVLPESLSKENRRAFSWKRANPVGSLIRLKSYPFISGLAVTLMLLYIAMQAVQSTWSYYTMFKFAWDETNVGISLSVVGVLVMFVQGVVLRKVIPRIGAEKAVILGFSFYILGLVLFGLANAGWMMYAFLLPYCLGGIAGPSLQSLISSQVSPSQQGELQGILAGLMSLTAIIGPLLMNNLFFWFSKEDAYFYFPGMPFLVGAFLLFIGLLLALPYLRSLKKMNKSGN